MKLKSPLISLFILMVGIALISLLGPAEATLGRSVRLVYLHGAWVWTALFAIGASVLMGFIAIIFAWTGRRSMIFHHWSRAFGRTGITFWLTYLPVSLWAMQANWNGLFLAEPRWRVAVIFAVAGLLLQLGLSFLPASWASYWNPAYGITLFMTLMTTDEVMHPPNPIQNSDAWKIQLFFGILTLLMCLAAWQLSRWYKSLDKEESQ